MENKKDEITNRLKRAEGQAKAIRRMYEEDKDCLQIIQQINAAKSALNKVATILLDEELRACYQGEEDDRLQSILENLIKLN